MNIKAEDIFNINGNIKRDLMFTNMFGVVPSVFGGIVDGEKNIDMSKINKKFIQSLYPNAVVFQTSVRNINDNVSCVTEERQKDEKPEYSWDGAYVLSQYRNSEVTVILNEYPAIITFDKGTFECIYDCDSDFDAVAFMDDFISKLPLVVDDDDDTF